MIINYLRIALRHLAKNRIFSAINLFGLTLGFLCFILLSLYVYDELSFDMFHTYADRTYRIIQHEKNDDGSIRDVISVPYLVGPEGTKQIPGIEATSHLYSIGRLTMGNEPAARDYEIATTVDPAFLSMFDFPLIEGNKETALSGTRGVVLTKTAAKKYLGEGPYLGKRIWSSMTTQDDKEVNFEVTGVVEDFPKNSHLQLDMLFSEQMWRSILTRFGQNVDNDWNSASTTTYIRIAKGADPKAIESQITEMVKKNYPADRDFKSTFTLQPMKDIHMHSHNMQGGGPSNGIKPFYVYMFAIVAGLILTIACLNYMNLSTASAFRRVREIGTRKALGAMRTQLISQFTGEAVILSVASLAIALAILQMILPLVNTFTEKNMSLDMLPTPWLIGVLIAVMLSGILSATYPAFIISRVTAVEAFKKEVKIGNRSLPMRKILVASQFAISIMMVACTIVIYQQVNYLRTKDVGFKKDNLIIIDINSPNLRRNFENVKSVFAAVPEVQSITTSTRVPGEWKNFPVASVKTDGVEIGKDMIFVGIDADFIATYNLQLVAGRNFVSGPSDSTKVIITKQGAKELGLDDPIGKIISIPTVRFGGQVEDLDRLYQAEVIGVVDDFHFESFRQKMMPVIFGAPNTDIQRIDYYSLRVDPTNLASTVEKLKAANLTIDPENPLEYTFLDDEIFENFYRLDEQRGQIFLAFSAVIICIASLGLFALVSYSIESRMKEIGVRKVLGATVTNIVTLVSKEFILLVAISGFIAVAAAWYTMNTWLKDFEYRVPLGVGVFALAVALALLIAFSTVCFRAIRAARANPVTSLRSE